MLIVIDGPSGSGKSSTAKAVAVQANLQYIDSGALYRLATLIRMQNEGASFFEKLNDVEVDFRFEHGTFSVFLDNSNVSAQIRLPEVASQVSAVAAIPLVRDWVNALIRRKMSAMDCIADGRDLGTVVFPDADLKFFMIADLDVRAKRRWDELQASGSSTTLDEVRKNLENRDLLDSSRETAPLKKADDAIEIDTSSLDFQEQVNFIIQKFEQLKTENP